jgi:hypothetical protein
MKLKYLYIFLFLATPIYSQIGIGISAGTNLFRANLNNPDYLNTYWHNGINLGIGGEYFISRKVSINNVIEFGYNKFDHYTYTGVTIPETRFISATGKDSKVIKVFGNLRFYTNPSKIFQAYITTGLGYISEDLGTITSTFYDINFGQYTTDLNYEGRHNFVHLLGIGSRIKFNQNFAIDVSCSYYSDYTNFLNTKAEISFVYLFNNN